MNTYHFIILKSFLITILFGCTVKAATIELTPNAPHLAITNTYYGLEKIKCSIRLTGDIGEGDAYRLKSAISKLKDQRSIGLCLNSEGGSYEEGLLIAEMLLGKTTSDKKLDDIFPTVYTLIEANKKCFSACAIIFMSGHLYITAEFLGYSPRRYLHAKGRLGFHSPYVQLPKIDYNNKKVETAFNMGASAVRRLAKLGENLTQGSLPNYRFMPQSLIINLLSHGPENFFLIDTIIKAKIYHIDLIGIPKPKRFNFCQMDYICANALTKDTDYIKGFIKSENNNPEASEKKCQSGWRQVKRSKQKLYFGSGFGGEALYYCVLKSPKHKRANIEFYSELVESYKSKINKYSFSAVPNSYYYPPETKIKTITY